MKGVLLTCLILGVMSVELSLNSAATAEAFEKLKESKWASWIAEFAELELSSGGVLTELVDAIH